VSERQETPSCSRGIAGSRRVRKALPLIAPGAKMPESHWLFLAAPLGEGSAISCPVNDKAEKAKEA